MKTKKNQKQISLKEYTETYCQERRIRGRYAVYVSPETHHNLKLVAGLFGSESHTTTSSLADTILLHHFREYSELLNKREQECRPFPKKPRMTEVQGLNEPDENDSESSVGRDSGE